MNDNIDMPRAREAVNARVKSGDQQGEQLFSGGVFPDLVGFDTLRAYSQALDALRCLNPHILKVREPYLFSLVLGVRYVMPGLGTFSTYIATS